jgi:GNAT superfamily N-acetyltransferase
MKKESMTEIRIIEEREITPETDKELRDALCRCFPPDYDIFSKMRGWHGSFPEWSVLIFEGGRIVGYVGIVDRVIIAGNRPLRIAGIQNVFTLPECRGLGYGKLVMDASMKEAGHRDFGAGLLFCVPELERLYAKCGWILLPMEEIVRVDEKGREISLPEKNIAMFYPLSVNQFPAGRIHLQGNDW